MRTFPEPSRETGDPTRLLPRYLHFYRETVIGKAEALPAAEVRTTRLPSGWTPIELLTHLLYMERRWFVWGFLAEPVPDPEGDEMGGRWFVPGDVGFDDVVARLRAGGERTAAILAAHPLAEVAALGGRFSVDAPTLGWIGFHVLSEYARHAGHLDVAVELAGGPIGE